jgi:branched-chain amino acid transport system substrate-binding protein
VVAGLMQWLPVFGFVVVGTLGVGLRPAEADIVIGLGAPMTGDNATVGNEMRIGAEAAIDRINSQGGVLGEKLSLLVEDDACDPKLAVKVANKLILEKVDFLIGHYCSTVTLPASSIYADNGTLEIVPASTPVITEQGFDGLFRIVPRNDRESPVLADFIAAHYAGKRVALIADHSISAVSLAAGLRRQLQRDGKVVVPLDQSVDAGTKDFSALLAAFKSAAIDVVAYVGYPTEAGLIVNQCAAAGLKLDFVSTNNMQNNRLWDIAGKNAEGFVFAGLPAAELMSTAQDAVEQLKDKGKRVEGYTLYSYASVQLYATAIARAQSTHTDAVAKQLRKGNIPTVLGDVSFDAKGDNLLPGWRMYRFTNGTYVSYAGPGE